MYPRLEIKQKWKLFQTKMFLTDLSIKRPVVASVMSLILVIFGLLSYQDIPTDELPNVQPPIVTIQGRTCHK